MSVSSLNVKALKRGTNPETYDGSLWMNGHRVATFTDAGDICYFEIEWIDAAAEDLFEAYCSKLPPYEFIQDHYVTPPLAAVIEDLVRRRKSAEAIKKRLVRQVIYRTAANRVGEYQVNGPHVPRTVPQRTQERREALGHLPGYVCANENLEAFLDQLHQTPAHPQSWAPYEMTMIRQACRKSPGEVKPLQPFQEI